VILLGVAAPLFVACFATIRRFPISNGVLIGLGGLTYPLYLLHQTIGYMVFNHSALRDHAVLLVALTCLAMIAASWMFYERIDKPLHAASRKALDRISARMLPRVLSATR
jgi:peptidoglycan/LPS O-acetylase OafA/YrhL